MSREIKYIYIVCNSQGYLIKAFEDPIDVEVYLEKIDPKRLNYTIKQLEYTPNCFTAYTPQEDFHKLSSKWYYDDEDGE